MSLGESPVGVVVALGNVDLRIVEWKIGDAPGKFDTGGQEEGDRKYSFSRFHKNFPLHLLYLICPRRETR